MNVYGISKSKKSSYLFKIIGMSKKMEPRDKECGTIIVDQGSSTIF